MGSSGYVEALGPTLQAAVKKARVLLVGAGGIGCELLKNLVCSGFGEIHVVDLDTIDLSNLNRQFLFRAEHIKKSKALVAKEQASRFGPHSEIVAYHANIKDASFNVQWFRSFTVVFNALDNLDARRHVNKMCLAANVPLIESGTTGFNGQTQVIKKGVTACYDCVVKETPKMFPVCTIRSTPSQPIHCVVWAKSYLLSEMFGDSEDESAFDNTSTEDDAKEIAELRKEAAALKAIRQSCGTPEFARMLFDKVFHTDIERLRTMEDMWKSRRPPEPLSYEAVVTQAAASQAAKHEILKQSQKVWSLEENFVVFMDSIERLSKRITSMKAACLKAGDSDLDTSITFDKDDNDTLDFVVAAANIRCHIFGIDSKSRFDIKQMAGNIIPAIATTNAVVAGLCVLQAYKVLAGALDEVAEIFLAPFGTSRRINSSKPREPEPRCPVCGVFHVTVMVDFQTTTVRDIVENLVQDQLKFGEREFSLQSGNDLLYDADEDAMLDKKLGELGLNDGTFLTVNDDDDEPFVPVTINMIPATEPMSMPVKLLDCDNADVNIPYRPKVVEEDEEARQLETDAGAGIDAAVSSVDGANGTATAHGVKRKAEDALAGGEAAQAVHSHHSVGDDCGHKRRMAVRPSSAVVVNEVVVIDDDEPAIVIDDD